MRAIDTHVHPGTKEDVIDCGGKYIEDAFRFFGKKVEALTEEALAEEYQSLDIMGILLGWDAETNTGNKRLSNEYIAGLVKKYPKTFIGFAGRGPLERQSGDQRGGIRHPGSRPSRGQVPASRSGLLPQ